EDDSLGRGCEGCRHTRPARRTQRIGQATIHAEDLPPELKTLDPMFKALPPDEQQMQLWAQQQPGVYDAQSGETEWSGEYFAKWLAAPQAGTLGKIPTMVLSRADGGFN